MRTGEEPGVLPAGAAPAGGHVPQAVAMPKHEYGDGQRRHRTKDFLSLTHRYSPLPRAVPLYAADLTPSPPVRPEQQIATSWSRPARTTAPTPYPTAPAQ